MRCVAIGVVVLAGCSSHDLTCAVLASQSNCFAQATTALAACVPMSATIAKLSSDQTTCTYPDGVSVVFDASLPSSHVNDYADIRFTVYAPDTSECGGFYSWQNQMGNYLVVSNGAAEASWETPFDENGYSLGCPSHTYTGGTDDTFECPGEPDFIWYSMSSPYSFTVRAGTPSLTITCQ